jgi:hypothetical protein
VQENETLGSRAEKRKAKIREKFRTSTCDGVEVIPAREKKDFFTDSSPKRVAVYVRVSTVLL